MLKAACFFISNRVGINID